MKTTEIKPKDKAMNKKLGLFILWIFLSGVTLLAQTSPNVNYVHDEAGNLVGAIDANGNAKAYTFDAEGNLVAMEKLVARGAVDPVFMEPTRGQRPVPPQPGTPVTILGVGFSAVASENGVIFNGTPAVVEESTTMLIKTRVPAGATSGPVVVTSPQGTGTSRSNFIITNVCVNAPSGMVSWWAGEGDASDVLGRNPGTVRGGVTFVRGRVGRAFSFDGRTGNIRIPASASLNVGTGDGFTIEAWINPTDNGSRPLVEWNDESGVFGVHFWIGASGPGSLYANVVDSNRGGHIISTQAGILRPNTFQHVALSYNKTTGTARLYVNGIVVRELNLGSFTPHTTFNLFLGTRPGTDGFFYSGKMDEVTLYNRALLTSEIESVYRAGEGGKCRP